MDGNNHDDNSHVNNINTKFLLRSFCYNKSITENWSLHRDNTTHHFIINSNETEHDTE